MPRFAEHAGGARVILKREDLNHTGSHKINNVLGQALLAKRLGKTRLIAETGAGQHGVATATAAALFGMECVVYMGEVDTERQALNVARMRLLGAEVIPVTTGSRTLKDAINDALRDWVANVDTTHYVLGTVAGPHPFPVMVRDFHKIIGEEARAQVLELTGRLPDAVAACVGGGSNAIGIFHAFLDDPDVALYGYEAAGEGHLTERHAATITRGRPGVLHGARSYMLQDEDGQTIESHSISAGLDYPGVGPEHAWLHDIGRAKLPSDHRRRGDAGDAPAEPHRGHHPRDRVGARPRRRARTRPRARARRRSSSSTSPVAATRTWRPRASTSTSSTPRRSSPRTPPRSTPTAGSSDERGRRRHRGTQRATARAPSSATCRSASPTCRRASTRPSRSSRTASTSSSSACRTPTR